jgi:hypothetical protein
MAGVFSTNDIAVLDQSLNSRTDIDPEGLYLIKNGNAGLIRHARMTTAALYIFSEDCRARPSTWQRVQLTSTPVAHAIRARVIFPAIEDHWAGRLAEATSR